MQKIDVGMNSICRYFGGKNGMFNNILRYFPQKGTYNTYIEPFGGSFAIGFHTPEDQIAPIEIYNDLYSNVYSLFKVLADETQFEEFRRLCDLSLYSEEMRAIYKEDLKREDLTDVERAFRFFYVNRTSHNGIGGFSMNRVIRRGMAKSVSDFLSTIDRLKEVHDRLSKVTVLKRDAIELMDKYSQPNVFMYLDPPYVLSTRSSAERYAVDMTDEEQERFIDACIRSKAKLLVSGYDCELYNKLLENGFSKSLFEVNTIDGARNPKTKTETVWMNYDIDTKEENN